MTTYNPFNSRRGRNKFGNKKVAGYDSKAEYNRAKLLQLKQQAGLISNLREQVPFVLIPAQYNDCVKGPRGIPRLLIERACKYIADFVYTDNETGEEVVEDTKGVRTKEYIIKRKLMLYVHGIRIKEV